MKQNLARYKVPREIVFLDELPRNATGKVLKRELAEDDPGNPQEASMRLEPGQEAPDFTLRDQHGQARLAVVVPGQQGGGTDVLPLRVQLRCAPASSAQSGTACRPSSPTTVQVLAISCDPMFALRAFAEQDGLTFPLLSDFWPHGAAARAYGVLDEERGCSDRSTFIVDREGVLRWAVHNAMRGRAGPRGAGTGARRSGAE